MRSRRWNCGSFKLREDSAPHNSPFSAARAFKSACGRAPKCWMISAAASAPSCAQSVKTLLAREAGQKAGGEKIAGAGRIDESGDRDRVHRMRFLARDDERALFAARHRRQNVLAAQLRRRAVAKSAV